ncbi:hypothetical protein [Paracoccus alkenifer]|uniref:hypothetical protein n=1 Tax=Paracoccus alkenifer TaxID=65735 RepID=UPI00115FA9EA|nr:hypothetical protein [Paracoccus alkenifer]
MNPPLAMRGTTVFPQNESDLMIKFYMLALYLLTLRGHASIARPIATMRKKYGVYGYGLFIKLSLTLLISIVPATATYADCNLSPTAMCDGVPCPSLTRPNGTIIYNSDHRIMQACAGGRWVALTPPTSSGSPASCAESWTTRSAPENNSWYSVTYGGGQFVAVGGDGTNRIMTSSDGVNWTARTAPEKMIGYPSPMAEASL